MGEEQEETEQVSAYKYDLVFMQYILQCNSWVLRPSGCRFVVGEANKNDE